MRHCIKARHPNLTTVILREPFVNPVPAPLTQKREFETRRKLDMILEWLDIQARLKQRAGAGGRTMVELIWEHGAIKRAKFVDEITIEDLSDKERELVLRVSVSDKPK